MGEEGVAAEVDPNKLKKCSTKKEDEGCPKGEYCSRIESFDDNF